MLLYRDRGTVVSSATVLSRQRENLRLLRKLLVGSRYQIINHQAIGYELVVTPEPAGPKPPPVRHMISAALEHAAPEGLSRAEIAAAISRDYGSKISGHTLTVTLLRMHAAGRVRRVGQTWFLM